MTEQAKVAIVGATGYGGAELLRNLLSHPRVEVARTVAIDHVGEPIGNVHANLYGLTELQVEEMPVEEAADGMDAVFFALPHQTSANVIMKLFESDVRIIDLSGDFRLQSSDEYAKYYGDGHPCHGASSSFAYGLPELNRGAIETATRIASPGCFATTITLALAPAASAGWLTETAKVVAMTGSSGSGAVPKPTTHHPLRAKNLRTYRPLTHQHTPEIEQTLRMAGASDGFTLQFVPVSAPLVRGIFATAFVDIPSSVTADEVQALYASIYEGAPFVRQVEGRQPEVNAIAGSMYAEVGWHLDDNVHGGGKTLVCFSAVDNLVKGGAGQAVQCFNIMMGWDETLGLAMPALWP